MPNIREKDYAVVEMLPCGKAYKILAFAANVIKAHELKEKLDKKNKDIQVRFGAGEWLSVGDEVEI